jgi:hypothetical protein
MSIDSSSQIVWPVNFVCTLINQDTILPNSYNINISIVPVDSGQNNLAVGYKKIKYFVDFFLHNSIIIAQNNPLLEHLGKTDNTIVTLPVEPYDLFVGHILYLKFLAISEKYFHIDIISIDSAVGDSICYNIADSDNCGLELEGDYWWNSDSTHTGHGPATGWGELFEDGSPRFEPKIIKGGKTSET